MCCEQLVCGGCARPVAEARCPICRATRAELHHHGVAVNVAVRAVIVTAILAAAAMLYGHFAG